jgi:hypothetical protein
LASGILTVMNGFLMAVPFTVALGSLLGVQLGRRARLAGAPPRISLYDVHPFSNADGTLPINTERRLLVSKPLFRLSPSLLEALRLLRDQRGHESITRQFDAFMLDPGLGPATFVSSDGRVLWDDDGWGVKGTRADAFASILAGAQKTGLPELRELLPSRPADASDCSGCAGLGRIKLSPQVSSLCMTCGGLGWSSPTLRMDDIVLDAG